VPRSGWLLLGLLVLLGIYPWVVDDYGSSLLFEVSSTLVAILGVWNLAASPRLRRLGAGLGVVFVVTNVLAALGRNPFLMTFLLLLALATYAVVIVGLLDALRRHRRVTHDTLCHALSAYIMIGLWFALVYLLINLLVPGSFEGKLHPGLLDELNLADLLYFSFTALTTAGFGDIVPVSPQARFAAVYEEIVGVVYTTVLISRLVSLYSRDEKD